MKQWLYIIIGILVIAGLGWWIWSAKGAPSSDTQGQTASTTVNGGSTATQAGAQNTFKSIFAGSGNHECIYDQVTSSSQTKSVIQIADGKMRGEFRTTSGNQTIATLMVYTGGYLYSWKEGATTGTRTSISSVADLPDAIPQDLTSGAIFGTSAESVGWDCHAWLKDATVLTVPSYVKFQ
jgi:hypothetical protein